MFFVFSCFPCFRRGAAVPCFRVFRVFVFSSGGEHMCFRVMIRAIIEAKKFGHNIKELNVGGGLGIKYTEQDQPPSIDQWVKTVSFSVLEACKKTI